MVSKSLQRFVSQLLPSFKQSGRMVAIALVLSGNAALAQSTAQSSIEGATRSNLIYAPPPGTTTPTSTGGTGSRGGCLFKRDLPPLASLTGQQHLSWTVSERSTIWIYVPYTPEEAPSGTLSIQLGEEEVYRGEFALAKTPGIIGIDLPETAPPLTVDQTYSWFIDINCAPASSGRPVAEVVPGQLDGFVQRVAVSEELDSALRTAPDGLARIAVYGEHHAWYDMLTELARLRLAANADDADAMNDADATSDTDTTSDTDETDTINDADATSDTDNADATSETDEINAMDETELNTLWITLLSDPETVNLGPFSQVPLVGEVVAEDVAEDVAEQEEGF